jgi:hypothetical protein
VGSLINNGDRNCNSGVVSTDYFSLLNGFTLESDIFLRVTNPAGCWDDAFIGLTKDNFARAEFTMCGSKWSSI